MIYHNVGLTKPEVARLRRVVKGMLDEDESEIAGLEVALENSPNNSTLRLRKAGLSGRRKFITKANLLRIFALRGLENMEQGGDMEETIDLMVRLGRAKGRPDGRR